MQVDEKWIEARYPGTCEDCGCQIYQGDRILYIAEVRVALCRICGEHKDFDRGN